MLNLLETTSLSVNNNKKMETIMPITISDEELLSMEPELLVSLQKYLKNFRDNNTPVKERKKEINMEIDELKSRDNNNLESIEQINQQIEHKLYESKSLDQLIVTKSWYLETSEAKFDEVETNEGKFLGTRISQDDKTYIARNWKITEEVKKIIVKAAENGFTKLWRQNHPQERYMIDGPDYLRGSHHIGFSKSHSDHWVFALGAESLSRKGGVQRVKEITFNKYYGHFIENNSKLKNQNNTSFSESILESDHYKIQNGSGYNYTTHPNDFSYLIDIIN